MLRTSFAVSGYSVPMQLVHEHADVPVEVRDLRTLDTERQQAELEAYTASERAAVFDITRAPLMRIGALLETDRSWRLTFTQCHAITEGWTFHSLVMEILDTYRTLRDGNRPTTVEPPPSGTPTSSPPNSARWPPRTTAPTGTMSSIAMRRSPSRPPGPVTRTNRGTTTGCAFPTRTSTPVCARWPPRSVSH